MAPRLPQGLATAVDSARHDKQKVRQTIHVTDDLGIDLVDAKDLPFGSAANCPADVQLCRAKAATWQDEGVQGFQVRVDFVAKLLKPSHVLWLEP